MAVHYPVAGSLLILPWTTLKSDRIWYWSGIWTRRDKATEPYYLLVAAVVLPRLNISHLLLKLKLLNAEHRVHSIHSGLHDDQHCRLPGSLSMHIWVPSGFSRNTEKVKRLVVKCVWATDCHLIQGVLLSCARRSQDLIKRLSDKEERINMRFRRRERERCNHGTKVGKENN